MAKIGGHDGVFGVAKDVGVRFRFRGFFQNLANLFVAGFLFQLDDEIDDGDVRRRDPEGHTGKLAVQFRQYFANCFSGSGGRWNNVRPGASPASPIFRRWTVDGFLRRCRCVYGRHETFLDAEFLVDNLRQRRQAVGRARRVRNHRFALLIFRVVDTDDVHRRIRGWGGNNNLLRAPGKVRRGLLRGSKNARRFNNHIHVRAIPLNHRRIPLRE